MRKLPLAALAAAVALAGCAELLPKTSSEVDSPWGSYEEARAAIERIEPGQTTLADLREHGISLASNPNIEMLSYSDIVLRFPMNWGLALEAADPGLRDCLKAGKECTGVAIKVTKMRRERIGNFWLDALRFKRETEITGWSFNALLLVIDGRIVYTLYGGQPSVREHEIAKNPLGPLQNWGDQLKPPDISP
ncbi:hypothetical protein [Usitatibacter palustris]|uniref:Lipoprotein n=1 Tax=Usitatibacter palustris TaxID=2732487 RepID=A0A6M4H5G3_9PROT|nr:hypothetical protein [Usitatibacter palustris]QJR14188.1 hypothetical protein DSM104440_00981 [Usitatibacter palustris]